MAKFRIKQIFRDDTNTWHSEGDVVSFDADKAAKYSAYIIPVLDNAGAISTAKPTVENAADKRVKERR